MRRLLAAAAGFCLLGGGPVAGQTVLQFQVDEDAHEAYIADGYGNHRVIVFDSETSTPARSTTESGCRSSNRPTARRSSYAARFFLNKAIVRSQAILAWSAT